MNATQKNRVEDPPLDPLVAAIVLVLFNLLFFAFSCQINARLQELDFFHGLTGTLIVALFAVPTLIVIDSIAIIMEVHKHKRWETSRATTEPTMKPPLNGLVAFLVVALFNILIIMVFLPSHYCGNHMRARTSEAHAGCDTVARELKSMLAENNGVFETAINGPASALNGLDQGDLDGSYFETTDYTISGTSITNGYYLVTCIGTPESGRGDSAGMTEGVKITLDSNGNYTEKIPNPPLKRDILDTRLAYARGIVILILLPIDLLALLQQRRIRKRWKQALSESEALHE